LLLLDGQSIHIIPHPASPQSPAEIRLDELLQFETGTCLLSGWLKFTSPRGVYEIFYNTRASRPLEEFLKTLKHVWCGTLQPVQNTHIGTYGDQLDIKFRNSLRLELDGREDPVVQHFGAPAAFKRKVLFLTYVDWSPGNLVLLTSMNRLLWITDQYRGRRELYASVSFSAAAASLRSAKVQEANGRQYLLISFSGDNNWRLPLGQGGNDTSLFAHSLNELVGPAAALPT
jgi:hypothetical protein